jgi:hypothetical protein
MGEDEQRPPEEPSEEEAKRLRAERLRKALEDVGKGRRPLTPREFTDRAAREAAEEEEKP